MNSYTYLAVSGQNTVALNSSNNTLNLTSSNGLAITTNATTNTVSFATSGTIPNLLVNTSFIVNPATTGTLDNVVIGATTPRAGTFSTLTITGDITFANANSNITIAPTGNGVLTIGPAQLGTINNMTIGATTPSTGQFTSLSATGAVSVTGVNASVNLSPTGTGVVTISPATTGVINNMTIGATTPSSAVFTTVTMTSQPAGANSAITNGYASALAAVYGVALA